MTESVLPTRVYLVRHGETEYNRNRIMQGRKINASLNATGRRQADALGKRFESIPLDAVYASSLHRAVQTAGAIATRQRESRVVRCMPAFDEMSWGRFEGMGASRDLRSLLDDAHEAWSRGDFSFRPDGGENVLEVQERSLRGYQEVIRRHPGETVAIVAHGRTLRVLIASILDEYGLERMNDVEHLNTCVNEFFVEDNVSRAVRLNCVSHLNTLKKAA